jgi:hypothetical protein
VIDQTRESPRSPADPTREGRAHVLRVTYEVDGTVVRVIEKEITDKYRWFLIGNSSWREW